MPRIEIETRNCICVNQSTDKTQVGESLDIKIIDANMSETLSMLTGLIHSLHFQRNVPKALLLATFKIAFDPNIKPILTTSEE